MILCQDAYPIILKRARYKGVVYISDWFKEGITIILVRCWLTGVNGYMSLGPGFIASRGHCVQGSLRPRFCVCNFYETFLQLFATFWQLLCNCLQLFCNFYATGVHLFSPTFLQLFWQILLATFCATFCNFFATFCCKKVAKSCKETCQKSCKKMQKKVAANLQKVA